MKYDTDLVGRAHRLDKVIRTMQQFDFQAAVEKANADYFKDAHTPVMGYTQVPANDPARSEATCGMSVPTSIEDTIRSAFYKAYNDTKAADAYVVDFGDLPPISRSCVPSAAPAFYPEGYSEADQLADAIRGSELWFNLTEPSQIDMGQELIYRDRDGTMRVRRDGDSSE